MDPHERDRRDPPDAEDAEDASSSSTEPTPDGLEPEYAPWSEPARDASQEPVQADPVDPVATGEIESWPSQDASSGPAGDTTEYAAWPTEPPAAGSADENDWPTTPPERGDEPILEPSWSAPSEPEASEPEASEPEAFEPEPSWSAPFEPEAAEPPPSEVEAYAAPRTPSADADVDADVDVAGVAASSAAATAAHAVPAGEGAIGESTQCPRCGAENRPGLAFCRNCGQRLVAAGVSSTVERPGAPEGTMACSRCGTHNRAGVAFCQNCGANLRGTAPGYVPPSVAAEPSAETVHVLRRGAVLGPVVLLIGLVGIATGYLLPFLYGSGSLFDRAMGQGGYGAAFWSGYPEVGAGLADQAYFGLAGPIPILGVLLLALAIVGFMRAVPGPLQTVGLGISLLWSVGLIVLFVVVELAGNWSGDLVGMLRVLTPAGIIFLLASLIVLIGTLTRFGRS